MKTYIKISIILVLTTWVSFSLFADRLNADGEFGWKMLTIPPNSSTSAMAGTGASISSEAGSFIAQPTAGLIGNIKSISASQMNWHFDTTINSIAINIPSGSRSLGLAMRSLDYGKFDTRDITGEIIGEFHPLDLNIIANMAFRMSPDLYTGINLYLLYQKIDSSSSVGLAADFGITYLTPVKGLDINAAIKHIGATSKVKNERIKLPLSTEVGLGYRLPNRLDRVYSEFKLIAEEESDIKAAMGANVMIVSSFELRLGYRVNYDSHSYSLGLGVNAIRNLVFNYAYLPFEYESNDAHSFGVTYRF